MKTSISQDTCIGCGLCPSIAPDLYEMGDDGKAHAISQDVPSGLEDAAKEAEESCPVNAIKSS